MLRSPKAQVAMPIAAGVLAVLIAHHGALDNPFVGWDDGIYVVHHPLVTAPQTASLYERILTPRLGYPLPLPVFLYGLLWAIEPEPWLLHGFNLLLHACNASLLAWLLQRELGDHRVVTAATLAFVVHPIVTEPVAWVTGLKDLLVGTAALLTLWGRPRGGSWAIVGPLLGLASKPSAVLLAPALLWLGNRRDRVQMGGLVLLTALGVALVGFSLTHQPPDLRTTADVDPSVLRVLGALGLHLAHLLAPHDLSHLYPRDVVTALHLVLGGAMIVAAGGLAVHWSRRRDPRLPWLVIAVAVYLPASNIIPLHRFTADSFFYVPWMGCVACLAHGWVRHRAWLAEAAGRAFWGLVALPWVLVPLWAVLTVDRVEAWSSDVALWGSAARHHPDRGSLVFHHGRALGKQGRYQQEREVYLTHLGALVDHDEVPGPLPLFFEQAGRLDLADQWYAKAFASAVEQPDMLYWQYAEYVARHPRRFRPEHAQALRHSLEVYVDRLQDGTLTRAQRSVLARLAHRVGRPDLAAPLDPDRGGGPHG